MEIIRCENGHFYDSDRFSECPHCNPTTPGGQETVNAELQEEQEGKTIGYFDWSATDIGVTAPTRPAIEGPVVGWVVATDGLHKGQDFPLKAGKNFIGRSTGMDIVLEDKTISRDRHAVIVYDPKSNVFLVAPGDARELFYLNGDVVLSTQQIKAYDVISLGKTQLTFVPFCNDTFSWDIKKEEV